MDQSGLSVPLYPLHPACFSSSLHMSQGCVSAALSDAMRNARRFRRAELTIRSVFQDRFRGCAHLSEDGAVPAAIQGASAPSRVPSLSAPFSLLAPVPRATNDAGVCVRGSQRRDAQRTAFPSGGTNYSQCFAGPFSCARRRADLAQRTGARCARSRQQVRTLA